MADFPLTTLVAGTGYGKSTTLASFFADRTRPLAWYSVGAEDSDPVRFLRHTIAALQGLLPGAGERSLSLLAGSWTQTIGERAIDLLCNDLLAGLEQDSFLVFDDYEHVDCVAGVSTLVERLLAHAPPLLHIVIASRRRLPLVGLPSWRARGQVLQIEQQELAFSAEEVAELFALCGQPIAPAEASLLAARTEGWPAALQLARQGLSGAHRASASTLLEWASPSLHALFDYLAAEVFNVRPLDEQRFLLQTSIVRALHPEVCDCLVEGGGSAALLRRLHDAGLFLLSIGPDHYRYQQLFQDFLQQQARERGLDLHDLHQRAAAFYRARRHEEEAIYHYLAAGDAAAAGALLAEVAEPWIRSGRAATLKNWLDRLPGAQLNDSPALLQAQGETARLLSHFDEALEWYRRAEEVYARQGDVLGQSRALRGQAQVYLDTVRPEPAERLLKRALKLLRRDYRSESSTLLHLLAENTTNRGRAGLAARLHAAAERIWPAAATTPVMAARVELRTGRLVEARRRLEVELSRAAHDQVTVGPPEAHREPLLLLALLECWMGEPAAGRTHAEAGLQRGRAISSPIVEAVAEIRLGHCLQLLGEEEAAAAAYERALHLAEAFGVNRTKAEPLMGMVLLEGVRGNLTGAEARAREALAILSRTGDEWMAALLWLALGAAATVAGHRQMAGEALSQAEQRFLHSNDTFGLAAVRLWRAITLVRSGSMDAAIPEIRALLRLIADHHYDFLITRSTLFTPRDRQMLPPLLLIGLELPDVASIARLLLVRAFPAIAADEETRGSAEPRPHHPGVTLRLQMLGRFRAWRGHEEIASWGREKARQMLQLLVTERNRWLQRDQIIERLWPDIPPEAAEGQFKVALNALITALEPNRPPRAPSFYIRRSGSAYRFAPPDGVQLDIEQFELLLNQAEAEPHPARRIDRYRRALALYSGDLLPESLYEDWAGDLRERLLTHYLAGACALAALLLDTGAVVEAIRWCETVLARDPCWEEAYRLLMRAYVLQGNRPQALRTYERCVRRLAAELDIEPLPETTALYESIREELNERVFPADNL